jgi:hypothetical protein
MDKQKTVWKAFMELVNSKEIGAVITRQEILQFITKYTEQYPTGCFVNEIHGKWENGCFAVKQFSPNTVDYIRNLSEKVGYLDKTRCAGIYVVNKHFPSGYTVSQLRKDYDSRTW